LAVECQAKLLLAMNQAKAADSVLSQGLPSIPEEEKPAYFLLKAQILRSLGKAHAHWIDSLTRLFPGSPEAQYARRFNGKIPSPQMVREAKKDSLVVPVQTAHKDSTAIPWVLQVGSFAQRENAQAYLDELAKQGYKARVMTTPRGSQTLWQVWLGAFPSAAAAELYGKKELTPRQILFTPRLVEP
jgi:SPOR domain